MYVYTVYIALVCVLAIFLLCHFGVLQPIVALGSSQEIFELKGSPG